jgi:arylsulfatase A-like enzyme
MPDKAKKSQKQPNILVIWGDDIGINNLSCYSHGAMAGAATGGKAASSA